MLFFGDIGSGKSSVLKAIEFALFGILTGADLSGDSLLRRGENKGSVELTFSIDGVDYTVRRDLTKDKKGSVSQGKKGTLVLKGEETSYSPSELRKKILSILNYSVTRYENAKKIPLFRYTVYTPQEQVKEILQADSKERFEILKEIFGIEKYEIALNNTNVINIYLNSKINEIDGRLTQIGEPEELIPEKEIEIEIQNAKIQALDQNVKTKSQELSLEQVNLDNIQSELNEFSNKSVEIDNKTKIIQSDKDTVKTNTKSLKDLKKSILETEKEIKKLPELKLEIDLSEDQIDDLIQNKGNQIAKKQQEQAVIKDQISNIDKLLKEGKCSLCGQQIHEKERFENELQGKRSDLDRLSKEIKDFTVEYDKAEKDLKNLNDYTKNETKKESLIKLLDERKKREEDLNALISKLNNSVEQNENEVKAILENYDIKDLDEFRQHQKELKKRLEDQKSKVKQIQSDYINLEKSLSEEYVNLNHLQEKLIELKESVELKKKLKEKLEYLKDIKNWMIDEFPILVGDIEKQILASSAQQFNNYFKEWFKMLVEEENIYVEIRPEDFEPVINVNSYDSPFEDLSGGEKSALALAYRLALNKLINEKYKEVKTKDLLILDEPTDGFSQQQVERMQYVFEKLNTSQMIIISHERTLDSFVTDIFTFKKENHETKVTK